jgi:carbon storage regulator
MLVIPRRKDEAIVVGDGIIVNVIDIQGDEVRLAIDYPKGTSVYRGEERAEIRRDTEEVDLLVR